MPKAVVEEQSNYFYEAGWGRAKLKVVRAYDQEFTYKSTHKAVQKGEAVVGEKGSFEKWSWDYEFIDGDNMGRAVSVETNNRVTSRDGDMVRLQAEAFLDRPLEVGEEVDTDLYEGMIIQLLITHQTPFEGRDGKMKYFSNVTEFAPDVAEGESARSGDDMDPPF